MARNGAGSLQTAVGGIALVSEKTTTWKTAKLDSVKIPTDEDYYMLATFCFDLSRKMNYLFRATREFASDGDQDLARQLIADNDAINAKGLSWEQRARIAEGIMLRTVNELWEEHEQALRNVAGR